MYGARFGTMIGALGLLLVAGASTGQAVSPLAAARATLEICGPEEARFAALPDSNWQPVDSALAHHRELRAKLQADMPSSPAMVLIYANGGDLATTSYSIVLSRDASGAWQGSAVGQSQVWIKGAAPNTMPARRWTLTVDQAQRLDRILVEPCFYAEPSSIREGSRPPTIGALGMTIETMTPGRRHAAFSFGDELGGYLQQIVDLATPPPRP